MVGLGSQRGTPLSSHGDSTAGVGGWVVTPHSPIYTDPHVHTRSNSQPYCRSRALVAVGGDSHTSPVTCTSAQFSIKPRPLAHRDHVGWQHWRVHHVLLLLYCRGPSQLGGGCRQAGPGASLGHHCTFYTSTPPTCPHIHPSTHHTHPSTGPPCPPLLTL